MRDFLFSGFGILYLVVALLCIVGALFELRHYTHVLQLSSYQFQGYFRSLRQNYQRHLLPVLLVISTALAVAAMILTMTSGRLFGIPTEFLDAAEREQMKMYPVWRGVLMVSLPLTIFLVILCIFHYRPKKAKKAFVVTPRVKRLFITIGCLIALWTVVWVILIRRSVIGKFPFDLLFHITGIYVWLPVMVTAHFLVPLANLINKPAEQSINNGFIRDAQRILKEQPKMRIIGVTGSFGKTSVKYYLTTLLSEQYNVLMTPESYNTPMGIVRTIREQMKPLHEIFVCEMGARHVHDIREITDFVHPDDGILTAIGEQHLETFHSLENIISTKYELLDAAEEKNGLKFVNGDDTNIRAHMKYPDAITYGLNEGNDFRAIDIAVTPAGTSFKVQLSPRVAERLREEQGYIMKTQRTPGAAEAAKQTGAGAEDLSSPGVEFHTTLVGAHNVQNIMGAIAVATLYGIPASKLKRAVRRIEGVPHRLELKRHGNVTILDDAYNSNPTGAATALETLALFKEQVKILVTPGMVELGEKEEEYNEAFGAHAAKVCDYIIFVGNAQRTAALVRGAKSAGFDETRLFVKETFDAASVLMYEIDAGKEKVILLENDLPDNY